MVNTDLKKIEKRFISNFNYFVKKGLILNDDLIHHSKSNMHSWIQYLLIKSGEEENIISIPEVKIRFPTEPIVYERFGLKKKTRNRYFSKVDVAFYNHEKTLLGVSEVFTMDESHGARPSKDLVTVHSHWLTPFDSIPHMINYSNQKPNFIIMITILMKKVTRIYWKTKVDKIDTQLVNTKNYYDTFKESWIKFKEKISIDNTLLLISEEGIEKI